MTDNKYETVAIMHTAEEAIKYCSATLKLKVFLTQGVPPTFVSLVLGFRKHFCLPKGFHKEKKVEKHWSTRIHHYPFGPISIFECVCFSGFV
jgi:hypothetical protein